MNCPKFELTQIGKNSYHYGETNYVCKYCDRQFVEFYGPHDYSDDAKQLCLKMYLNGMGIRGIERVTGINYSTIINWVSQAGLVLPDVPEFDDILEMTELDEQE